MAIGFDAVSYGTAATAASITWSHTTTTSGDRLMLIGARHEGTVSSVTYNAVGATSIGSRLDPIDGGGIQLFRLTAPATGANNVVWTNTASTYIAPSAITYTGVDQTTPVEASNTGTANSTSLAVAVTTLTDLAWAVGYFGNNQTNSMNAGSGTSLRSGGVSAGTAWFESSPSEVSPAGSKTLNTNISPSGQIAMVLTAVKPVAAASFDTLAPMPQGVIVA